MLSLRRGRLPFAAAAAGAFALAAPAVAAAVPLTITPARPAVAKPITVAFTPKGALPAGQRYTVSVTIDGTSGECTTVAAQTSTSTARRVRITIRSTDGNFDGGPRWCAGTATITVLRGKASGGAATTVGRTRVRVR